MKKLLEILGTITIAGSGMTGIIGNAPTPAKNEINSFQTNNLEINTTKTLSLSDYLEFNNKYIEKINLIKFKEINLIKYDNKNNLYFTKDNGLFLLRSGETTPTKINNINDIINSITFDNQNNVYFSGNEGIYSLKDGEVTATKINGINEKVIGITKVIIDKQNNVYFLLNRHYAYMLKARTNKIMRIEELYNSHTDKAYEIIIDNYDNVYFGTIEGLYVLKANNPDQD